MGSGGGVSARIVLGGAVSVGAESLPQGTVVTAEATDPAPEPDVVSAHLDLDLALRTRAGVVLAGPNSAGLEGTDVLAARVQANALELLSTVDVADLQSGVSTTVLAGKEQILGRQGHYGALARTDAPLPSLPVR